MEQARKNVATEMQVHTNHFSREIPVSDFAMLMEDKTNELEQQKHSKRISDIKFWIAGALLNLTIIVSMALSSYFASFMWVAGAYSLYMLVVTVALIYAVLVMKKQI